MRFFCHSIIVCLLFVSAQAESRLNIRQHGAIGDGKALDTAAIQKSIDACAEAGGGTVVLPAGRYLSGSFFMRSRVNLHLEPDARLIGTTDLTQYAAPSLSDSPNRIKPSKRLRGLVNGENLEEIAITGSGTIDGNKVFNPAGEERRRGPHTIILTNCRRVTVSDVTIVDSANYAIYFSASDDVEVRNAKFVGGWDGIHWRGTAERWCKNVNIIGCRFSTGDDAIAGCYWDRTVIKDCAINSSCNGIRLIGPATHLTISNNRFSGPGQQPHRTSGRTNMLAAILLQPGAWYATTGPLDHVLIDNNIMTDIASSLTLCAKPGNTVGKITVNGLKATGVYRAALSLESWAEAPIDRVVLRNLQIEYAGGGTSSQAAEKVPPPKIDPRSLPVWGLYARNIRHLTLDDVDLKLAATDLRPVMKLDQVESLNLNNFASTQQTDQ